MAINDSSDVLCFVLYLINIFEKSTETERCTDVMLKLYIFRYALFRSPRFYFRCTVGARHKRTFNFSCPVKRADRIFNQ